MMKQHEFIISLGHCRSQESLHEEVLMVPEESCISLKPTRVDFENMLVIRVSYVAMHIVPYFDLLHDYSAIHTTYITREGKVWGRSYDRSRMINWTNRRGR